MYVGIDWASRAHELCVVDETGAVVEGFGFAHTERGISGALARLAKLGRPCELPVAIERPDGRVWTFSVQANHHALPGRAVIAQIDSVVVDMGRDVDRAIELRTQLEQDPRFSGVPIVVDLDLG